MILQAEHLTFSYLKKKQESILQDFNLSIASGERVGLKAPSGQGKTTFCKLLAGYEKPQQGKILLDGMELSSFRGVCPVQMVWQHPETVVDPLLQLGVTLNEAGKPEERLLKELHIEEGWLKRYPSELSGGELQRLALARVMLMQPKLVVLDEPTSMLDVISQAQVIHLLEEVQKREGVSYLFISHDQILCRRFCSRILELGGE